MLGPGDSAHRVLIAAIAGLENLRVALVVSRRIGNGEDTRYQELRRRWRERGREQSTFAIFYEAQALLAAILALPFVLAAFNRHDGLEPVEWAGAALWVVAFVLGCARRRAAPPLQGRPGEQGQDDALGPLALLAPSELLLPVARLDRVRARRLRRAVGLARLPLARS